MPDPEGCTDKVGGIATALSIGLGRNRLRVLSATPRVRLSLALGLLLSDALALCLFAYFSCTPRVWPLGIGEIVAGSAAILFIPVLVSYLSGAFRAESIVRGRLAGLALPASLGWAGAWLVAKGLETKLGWHSFSPPHVLWGALASVCAPLWTFVSRDVLRSMLRRSESSALVVLIGSLGECRQITTDLRTRGRHDQVLAVVCDGEPGEGWPEGVQACAPVAMLNRLRGAVRAVVCARSWHELPSDLQRMLIHARVMNVPVLGPADFYESLWARVPVHFTDVSWIIDSSHLHRVEDPFYAGTKRLFDVTLSFVGLLLAAPVLILTAVAVRLTSRGPALFRQRRTGQWEHDFTIIKFRTMHLDAEVDGARWASKDDPRVTRIGVFLRKSRLDELPQLWNVLMGDMSLVGPRPERPEFNSTLEQQIPFYNVRHLAKPGLTGWAQINHSYGASVEDAITKLEFDIWYVKNASLLLDLRILLRTSLVVLGLRGR